MSEGDVRSHSTVATSVYTEASYPWLFKFPGPLGGALALSRGSREAALFVCDSPSSRTFTASSSVSIMPSEDCAWRVSSVHDTGGVRRMERLWRCTVSGCSSSLANKLGRSAMGGAYA